MKVVLPVLRIPFISFLLFLVVSCEKETNTTFSAPLTVPIMLVTTESQNTQGGLSIDYRTNSTLSHYHDLRLNEVIEIELELTSEIYHFTGEDPTDGKLDLWMEHSELVSYTKENPLILKYGHYKDAVIAQYTVLGSTDSFSLVSVELEENNLYHVDWGDGTTEVIESNFYPTSDDRSKHIYESDGEYTITVTTTDLKDVTSLSVNVGYLLDSDTITSIEIGNLPNLNLLNIGYNTIFEVTNISSKFPKLKYFFFESNLTNTINLTNNSELERLALKGDNLTTIEGLEGLTKLKFLSLECKIESLDTSQYSEIEYLDLFKSSVGNLDLSNNKKLQHLGLTKMELSSLDLSNNEEITSIFFDDISLPIYDFSNLNKLEYLLIRALIRGEIKYPNNMDNMNHIDYSSFSLIDDVVDFTELMLESQKASPREKVTIKFPRNRYPRLDQQDELAVLVEDWNWYIEYNNN